MRARVVDVAEIERDGSNIAIWDNGTVKAVADDRSHRRGGGRSVQWIYSGAEVAEQLSCVHGTGEGLASVSGGAIQLSTTVPA